MIKCKLDEMSGGWFVGNFKPVAHHTKDVEVAYKKHPKGEKWPRHFHKEAIEINLLTKGKMTIETETVDRTQVTSTPIHPGDIFVIERGEIAEPHFLEDCEMIVIKLPSVVGDKYDVPRMQLGAAPEGIVGMDVDGIMKSQSDSFHTI